MPFVFIIGQVKHIEIIGRMPRRTYPTLVKKTNQANVNITKLVKKKRNLSPHKLSQFTQSPEKQPWFQLQQRHEQPGEMAVLRRV